MKKLAVMVILSLMSTSALALIPRTIDQIWVAQDFIMVTDKQDKEWMIKQNCKDGLSFTSDSVIKVTAVSRKIKEHTSMLVNIDGDRNICQVTEVLLLTSEES